MSGPLTGADLREADLHRYEPRRRRAHRRAAPRRDASLRLTRRNDALLWPWGCRPDYGGVRRELHGSDLLLLQQGSRQDLDLPGPHAAPEQHSDVWFLGPRVRYRRDRQGLRLRDQPAERGGLQRTRLRQALHLAELLRADSQ